MKIMILSLFSILTLYGSILDDWNTYHAQQSTNKKEYQKALMFYKKIKHKNDTIYYNIANLYYYLNQYENAISYYTKINSSILMHQKFHNLANCYIKLQEFEKAIEFNKTALTFKVDPKTKYNLELAKVRYSKILHKVQQAKNEQKLRAGTSIEIDEANMFNDDSFEIDESKLSQNKSSKDPKSSLGISNMENTKDSDIAVKDIETDDNNINANIQLSKYTQQKWDKKMNTNTKLHTLVIPLSKGNANDSSIPW